MKLATHNELLMMNSRQLKAYHKKLAKADQEAAKLDLELKQAEQEQEMQEEIERRDYLLKNQGALEALQSQQESSSIIRKSEKEEYIEQYGGFSA